MKTAGLIGGISPESTIEYYRFLIEGYRARFPGGGYPAILIDSIDLDRMVRLFDSGDLDAVTDYLVLEIGRLAAAGADLAAIAANTPHVVFDRVSAQSPIPLISIVEATCEAARGLKLKRVGLFGTRFTMQGRFYPDVLESKGIEVAVPEPDEVSWIHERYLGELVKGIFRPETREGLLAIARRLRDRRHVEGIILGGTELPLILRDAEDPGIPWLDTTRIHVDRILEALVT